ncbi:MFS transporter [Bacteriovoracaceae bacterium]|nr:MFS transporter [Bacteriovoracaceae bacterium]
MLIEEMNTNQNNNIQYIANIKKIYLFSFFWMFLVIIPIIVPYFLSLGLDMKQIFQLQAIFGFTVAILEVPSGYLCDLWGRKKTICIGSFLSGIGFTWLYFIDGFFELVLYEILIGIALSLVSGADISLLYESLNYKNDDRLERTKAMGNYQFSKTTAEAIASLLGGALVIISFKATIVAHAFFSWVPFIVALTIIEAPYKKMDREKHFENIKKVFKHLFFSEKLIRLIFLNLVTWGLSTFIAVWIFQKYWQDESISLGYFGILWAGYNFSIGFIGKQVHRWEEKFGPTTLLIALSLFPIIGYFGMAFASGWLGVILGLSFQFSRGITQVILRDAFNWRVPGEFRATANSLSSLFFRLGFCLIGPLVGYSIDGQGLSNTLIYLGIGFSLLFITLSLPLIKEVNKIAPDKIPSSHS